MDIRQNTASTVWVGPFKSTDGVTSSTGLTVSYLIAKNNGTFVATTGTNSESTGVVAYYKCPLTATNVNTLGNLKIAAQSSSEYLDVWDEFSVVTANYYDTRYGTDEFQVDVVQVVGSTSATDELLNMFDGTGYAGGGIRLQSDWVETNGDTEIDTGLTPATWTKEIYSKFINQSFKDSNEYKFYSSTGAYLFSLDIATTSRTRSS